jgi:hypothetical protein
MAKNMPTGCTGNAHQLCGDERLYFIIWIDWLCLAPLVIEYLNTYESNRVFLWCNLTGCLWEFFILSLLIIGRRQPWEDFPLWPLPGGRLVIERLGAPRQKCGTYYTTVTPAVVDYPGLADSQFVD